MAPLLTISVLLTVASLVSSVPMTITAVDETDKESYKLPNLFKTVSYDLSLSVSSEVFTGESAQYDGTVSITFQFLNRTNFVSLHAHKDYINITSLKFNNVTLDAEDYSIDNDTNILSVDLTDFQENIVTARDYQLVVDFVARLSTEDMYGFYRSSYVDKNNKTKYLATTQFEPVHARKAYPCFDEPSFKATFNFVITYPKDLTVLFNTNPTDSTTNDTLGLTTTKFEVTPQLSTYLIAFIVSEFTCSNGTAVDGVAFRVCSRDEVADTRKVAVQVGSTVIEKLNAFTAFNYNASMKKMDQVAIPDFSAGAMENWGLVTYREAALLYDEAESSNRYKQRITTVIAHEFTHQWFGDLVTCKWWSEIFLNEGFATYFEYHIAKEVEPTWELEKQFLIEQVHSVLEDDAFENSQALQSDAYTPTEISNKFGSVSYNKGGSILRMVANVLGADTFQKGLQKYLNDSAYSSAVPEDLWTALQAVLETQLPAPTLEDVMKNWIKESGFPLITVKSNGRNLTLTQERFLYSDSNSSTKWYVPISYTTSTDEDKFTSTTPKAWLTPSTNETLIELPENSTWIILNNQQTGYFRVNYDDALWTSIRSALQGKDFSGIVDLNRAQIVDDLFNLARADKLEYSRVFTTSAFLANDTSYYPWYAAFNGYDFLLKRVGQNRLGKAISSSLLGLMQKLYESVPFSNVNATNQIYTHKQVLALTWACRLGNEDCIGEVSKRYGEYKTSKTRPDKNLRTVVYCNALRYSNDSQDWDFLWNAYLNATDLATEQVTILSALGCTKDTALLKAYLNKTITDNSGIRPQDALSAYASVYSGNAEGVAVAYEFLEENHEKIAEKYQSLNALGRLITGIAEKFTTAEEIDKLKKFVATEGLPEEFVASANEAIASAEHNQAWVKTFEKQLNEFYGLDDNGAGSIGGAPFLLTVVVALVVSYLWM
ncbi:hypothetical protein NQ315_003104 [Exocentrus adspersus]|uniref:Aminopeptidase n=1 Tax=Exocentrus adspersus TaxID=1586481 RepID=A0AAV8W5S5_9CUCU|nr:hypothetical protein NQ315_003104 [Exocentrus adspersus]